MSVAEILHQIEALRADERLELRDKLIELTDAEMPAFPSILSEAERLKLEENLRQRPNLGAELGEKIDRMKAGQSIDFEELKILLHLAQK
jgi:hypothetical protein